MNTKEMIICLWFDEEAEEAVNFYTSIFKDSEVGSITRYSEAIPHKPEGTVLTIEFRLKNIKFVALNGGPIFRFNESVSITVPCNNQDEVDYYWNALTADGGQEQPCGWLKDKFGLSWQIVPVALTKMLKDKDPQKVMRATQAFMKMKKFDIAKLTAAFEGN